MEHSAQISVEKIAREHMVLRLMGAWDRIAPLRWWRAVVIRWNEMVMIYGVITIGCVPWAWVDQTLFTGSDFGWCIFKPFEVMDSGRVVAGNMGGRYQLLF